MFFFRAGKPPYGCLSRSAPLRFSISLKNNYEFRRLYTKGRSAASPYAVVYCRENRSPVNRLGLTVSTKLGKAVRRNRVRRRYREIYRLNEVKFQTGYDIVIVARLKSLNAHFRTLEADFLNLSGKLGLLGDKK
jgi:ribonuclease P protein component